MNSIGTEKLIQRLKTVITDRCFDFESRLNGEMT